MLFFYFDIIPVKTEYLGEIHCESFKSVNDSHFLLNKEENETGLPGFPDDPEERKGHFWTFTSLP